MIIERLGLITELTEPDVVPTAHLLIETIIERLAYVPDTPEQRQSAIDDCVEDFVELCDILGIDCSREEVEQIIEKFFNLRNAESSPEIPESELPNYALSDLGTHEGLAYFLKGSVSLATAGRTIHNALGQRALLDLAS